jgi:hypothetical protein
LLNLTCDILGFKVCFHKWVNVCRYTEGTAEEIGELKLALTAAAEARGRELEVGWYKLNSTHSAWFQTLNL